MTLHADSSLPENTPATSLSSLFSQEEIILSLKGEDRWGVIRELVDLLESLGRLTEIGAEEALEALYQREETMSTGIGFGVAIPHAAMTSLDKMLIAFGRSPEGVNFESLDGKPVHFVFLILIPTPQDHLHLKTLSQIAHFFNDAHIYSSLLEGKTTQELMQLFQEYLPQA